MNADSTLRDKRVLVLEDSYFIALALARMVQQAGAHVLGPASGNAEAMQLVDALVCDVAILDVSLGEETSEPIAELLAQRGVPFVFVTGYGDPDLSDAMRRRPRLCKPVEPRDLHEALARALQPEP